VTTKKKPAKKPATKPTKAPAKKAAKKAPAKKAARTAPTKKAPAKKKAGALSPYLAAKHAILERAMSYPGAWEDSPWGHTTVKVKTKIFVFVGATETAFDITVKLPRSNEVALMLPFSTPTGYGLGKAGWITASFHAPHEVPLGLCLDWLDESYRAVAPKKLVDSIGT
jgi:predicted DNA-binding protein (MmcQ/YjbR family)